MTYDAIEPSVALNGGHLVLFIGLQASGKSSFYRERFFGTHVRVNLDMLKTRNRESLLVTACLQGKITPDQACDNMVAAIAKAKSA